MSLVKFSLNQTSTSRLTFSNFELTSFFILKSKSGNSICAGRAEFSIFQFDKRHSAEWSTPMQSEMASHSLTRSGDMIHICSECEKTFGQSGHLKRHLVTHIGDKTHICSECQKSFGQATHLKAHMLIHTKERAYKCVQCSKSFGQAANL